FLQLFNIELILHQCLLIFSSIAERAIARHEVREIEQRHIQDGAKGALVEEDDLVVIYNRVPKTASTSFTNIAYDLCNKNHYHVLHINTSKNNPVMSLQDQVSFRGLKMANSYH
uniref:Sulfotransferase n=1 Tax=Sinocyclocheilus anshuiensis TaxID=1608454 RepID=A0A671MLT2_9TELE